ncbi:glutamate--tRNA ligase [bacterium]|nr:glutamate--tRNA ligase [bacterium]|tara:strand:- start:31091 stop:32422 length:1332 start_codon:yes stop_codon:yes gene_type:complete
MTEKVITRFPPSPTGSLHIGNIRSLLFNYLYTRKHGGNIVMRFEDTDKERSDKVHEAVALETLEALGLDFDRGPFRQSERTEKYVSALNTLIEKDLAFVAEESEGEPGKHVIRFRNPNKTITFHDIIRGDITIDTTGFGDFVIARSEDSPVYHLSVVVDDIEMGVTHVIRGEDHITSTPRQILLIEALGGTVPTYAHLPLIVGSDKKKLGKRHGAVTYQEFRDLGYVPSAIVNYLALLGWNPGDDREFFTKDELIKEFSLERVNNSPASFSYKKLDSINRHHILQMPEDEYLGEVKKFLCANAEGEKLCAFVNFEDLVKLVIRERINKFSEVTSMFAAGEFDWLLHAPEPEVDKLLWKDTSPENTRKHLGHVIDSLDKVSNWTVDDIKEAIWPYAERNGRGEVLWPMRFALTGQEKSPDPFTVAFLLGKEEALTRLQKAEQLL